MNKKLLFFNKEGDNLNVKWNKVENRWESDLIFEENSSDTFKTLGLYIFEKVDGIDFISEDLILEKWQLFNEKGILLKEGSDKRFKINKIEPTNNDSSFFSKWIYIDNSNEIKLGSLIRFKSNIFEFQDINRNYEVINKKKDAILIISQINNNQFNIDYSPTYSISSEYINKNIEIINSISILDYKDSSDNSKLSFWNERNFWKKLINGRKLSIINSENNNSVVTLKNKSLEDSVYYSYYIDEDELSPNSKLIMEVNLLTNVPVIYNGPIQINTNNIQFLNIPKRLLPGTLFRIPESALNTSEFEIDNIEKFDLILTNKIFNIGNQVIWNNKIYQCITAYEFNILSPITPTDTLYWTEDITYLPIKNTALIENITYASIQLTTNRIFYTQEGENDNKKTISKFVENWKDDLNALNIELLFNGSKLMAKLKFGSLYADVKFYNNSLSNEITNVDNTFSKNLEVFEKLKSEDNTDISVRNRISVKIEDISDFGLKIYINNELYEQSTLFVVESNLVNKKRTIDRTLREWYKKWKQDLSKLGIIISLSSSKNSSFYFNTVNISTQYPNVPFKVDIKMGDLGVYKIRYKDISFLEIGSGLSIQINNIDYYSSRMNTIGETLDFWIEKWSIILENMGIFVEKINNETITINILRQDAINTFKIDVYNPILPGESNFIMTDRIVRNMGMLITSNSALLIDNNESFIKPGISVGTVINLLNTTYTYNNQEYNILFLDNKMINFSYQGPFWGSENTCTGTQSIIVEYSDGSTYSLCENINALNLGSSFDASNFDDGFNIIEMGNNQYSIETNNLLSEPFDILYNDLSQKFFVLTNNLESWDAETKIRIKNILLPLNLGSKKIKFNNLNNYLYVLTYDKIYKIDTIIDEIISTININWEPSDIEFDNIGNVYVSYISENLISIYDSSDNIIGDINTDAPISKMENQKTSIFGTKLNDELIEFKSDLNIYATYSITNINNTLLNYEPLETILAIGDNLFRIDSGTQTQIIGVTGSSSSNIKYNKLVNNILISKSDGEIVSLDSNLSIIYKSQISNYGELSFSGYDGDYYLSSNQKIIIVDSRNGFVKLSETIPGGNLTKISYIPNRRSMLFIQKTSNRIVEILVNVTDEFIIENLSGLEIFQNNFGTLSSDYQNVDGVWLKTRDTIRKPRHGYSFRNKRMNFKIELENDPEEIFILDFSGDNLESSGPYTYTGNKPLDVISLNREENKDITKVDKPEYQKTIFKEVKKSLDFIDSSENPSFLPEPFEIFIGFKSENEGISENKLKIYEKQEVEYILNSNLSGDYVIFTSKIENGENLGIIKLSEYSTQSFINDNLNLDRGFEIGQMVNITLTDISNQFNQYISKNNGLTIEIKEIYNKEIVFFLRDLKIENETTIVNDYPSSGKTTLLRLKLKVVDKLIASFNIKGQTEIEDIRYKIELSNTGKEITADNVWIFKDYDINEQGFDWTYLNRKRKELLLNREKIFPYIGSYKAIINAINFFGYNDLQLFEYYRNINENSNNFEKLFKVEIPDIFNNSIKGWTEIDFIKQPNSNFKETNLFNLTYRITDKDGNNTLSYSLKEVLIKLQGLKKWLERNVIPITHKIQDITGISEFKGKNIIQHNSYDIKTIKTTEVFSPVDFNINESYLLPINSGSSVYNIVLEFSSVENPDHFYIKIKTWEKNKQWEPFIEYSLGEKVTYMEKQWESTKQNNRNNIPSEWINLSDWKEDITYLKNQIVKYKSEAYQLSSNNSISEIPGINLNWSKISSWKEINLLPVQDIREWRTSLEDFNFTIDTNIDPYITIEVRSDNGRGSTYNIRKSYEIRWIDDISGKKLVIIDPKIPQRI